MWRYIWRVLNNLVLIVLVWAILGTLHTRLEVLLVSILGLIYTAVRGVGLGQGYSLMLLGTGLDAEFRRIRFLLKAPPEQYEKEALVEMERKQSHAMAFLFINSVGLTIVSLLCLYFLLTAPS